MTYEHTSQTPNSDPDLQKEISLHGEISRLRHSPEINCEDLLSSNKMRSGEYPDRPAVRLALDAPIDRSFSTRSDVRQNLMAVVTLGEDVAVGVVKGRNKNRAEASYLSLLSRGGRAKPIDVLSEGTSVTLGRDAIEEVAGYEGASPGVSRKHCTIELKDDILTVIDETSTNGTSVFNNATSHDVRIFHSAGMWAHFSQEIETLIETEEERREQASRLGRFVVNDDDVLERASSDRM